MLSHALAWIAAAGAILSAPPAAATAPVEGEVVSVVEDLLLVRSAAGEQVFELEPAASFVGVEAADQLLAGDCVHVTWSRERSGVRGAERVELPAPIGIGGAFAVSVESLPAVPGASSPAPLFVDLRPAVAFESGHLPGAVSIPRERLRDLGRIVAAPGDRKVIFYGERRVDRELVDALRRALALGWKDVGYLQGGVRTWDERGRPLLVTPSALASGLGGAPRNVLDIRERERAIAGTIPGAISLPRSAWRWQQFSDGRTIDVVVLVGEDGQDVVPLEAAEQLRRWTGDALMRRPPRIRILEGGWKGWADQGRKRVEGAGVSGDLVWAIGPGEVAPEEFHAAFAADLGPKGPLVVDVSGERTAPAWGKSIPLGELLDRIGELPRDREIFLYCRVGRRAEVARAILVRNGLRARFLNGTNP